MRCFQMAPGTGTATVAAGDTLGFVAMSSVSHFGPVQFYMARVPDGADINTWEAAGNVWFKAASISAVPNASGALTSGEDTWPAYSKALLFYSSTLTAFTLPISLRRRDGEANMHPLTRQKERRVHDPEERPDRQLPYPRGEYRAAPGAVGGRGADLPLLRPGPGHRRRQRDPGPASRFPRSVQGERPGPDLVLLPGGDHLHGSWSCGLAGVETCS